MPNALRSQQLKLFYRQYTKSVADTGVLFAALLLPAPQLHFDLIWCVFVTWKAQNSVNQNQRGHRAVELEGEEPAEHSCLRNPAQCTALLRCHCCPSPAATGSRQKMNNWWERISHRGKAGPWDRKATSSYIILRCKENACAQSGSYCSREEQREGTVATCTQYHLLFPLQGKSWCCAMCSSGQSTSD